MRNDALVDALQRDPDSADLGARSRAFVQFAQQLTLRPHDVTEASIAPLREAGLDDRGIHDLVAVVAYFNFVNRMASGLGVQLEDEHR